VAQLKKLSRFIEARRRNWQVLHDGLKPLEEYLILPQPTLHSEPSWFGFPITVRPLHLVPATTWFDFWKAAKSAHGCYSVETSRASRPTRPVLSGRRRADQRRYGHEAFVLDRVYPGLTDAMLRYMIETVTDLVNRRRKTRGKIHDLVDYRRLWFCGQQYR